jgi:hypothetical protein
MQEQDRRYRLASARVSIPSPPQQQQQQVCSIETPILDVNTINKPFGSLNYEDSPPHYSTLKFN